MSKFNFWKPSYSSPSNILVKAVLAISPNTSEAVSKSHHLSLNTWGVLKPRVLCPCHCHGSFEMGSCHDIQAVLKFQAILLPLLLEVISVCQRPSYILFILFWHRVLISDCGWPWALPVSAYWMLRLKVRATTSNLNSFIFLFCFVWYRVSLCSPGTQTFFYLEGDKILQSPNYIQSGKSPIGIP